MVSGTCVKASPANTTNPIRSLLRPWMKSAATFFAASRRLGRKSSASMLPERSIAMTMSMPSTVIS